MQTSKTAARSDLAPRLLSVPDTEATMDLDVRYLIFHDIDNFATECVVRVGRAVRIRSDRLTAWIDRNTGKPAFEFSKEWKAKNLLTTPVKRAKTMAKKSTKRQPARAGR